MHSIVRCALFWLFLSNAVCLRGQSPPQKVHGGQPPDTTFASLSWRSIGPTQYSGRVDAIAVPRAGTPGVDRTGNVIYIAGAGGIWKTSNSGASWTPVFDNQPISEVRTLALAPSNQEVVWAGTGFFSHGIHGPVPGVGVFKSLDAGATWQAMGLAATEYVMRIAVQPGDSEVVLVAAQGPVTRASADRGIYRTADGGKSWTRVLFINEWTGAADVLFDPVDPKVAYAATWEYAQSDLGHVDGGPGSGIFKSTDGGLTWRRLGRGLPIGVLGKLQLAVASSQHDRVYAVVLQVAEHGGGPSFLYRSDDGGENWVKQCELRVSAYLQGLAVDPRNPDRVYLGDAFGAVSTDGGKTTKPLGDPTIEIRDLPRAPYDEIHDVHNIWVNPDTPNEVIICSDWGVAFSRDEGVTFQRFNNLPIPLVWFARPDHSGPFYRIHVAVRDNDTAAGPNRTRNRLGVVQSDWYPTLAGEDIDVVPNPSDPEVTYIYRHGGMVGGSNILRHDTRTGLLRILSPPVGPGDSVLNKRGCAVSVSRHSLLYCTSNDRLLISSDGGESWHQSAPFSLVPADEQPASLDGKTLIRYGGGGPYQAVTAVADSAVDSQVIYLSPAVGTVTVTRDGGKTWAQHKLGEDVPPRLISDIVTSPSQRGTAYITMPALPLQNH